MGVRMGCYHSTRSEQCGDMTMGLDCFCFAALPETEPDGLVFAFVIFA